MTRQLIKIGCHTRPFKLLLLLFTYLTVVSYSFGQTKGLIYKESNGGQSVLDPNGDGFTSSTTNGFISNDEDESEIPFVAFPSIAGEPNSDVRSGSACGSTDLVKSATDGTIYTYTRIDNPVDNTEQYLIFRFRLSGSGNDTKGYSILIDTDEKFGLTGPNADPNAVVGNPGFEVEILMVSNIGVGVYDVDGTTSATEIVSPSSRPYDDFVQKSVALTEECADDDYFYDFYLTYNDLASLGITPLSDFRMVGQTIFNSDEAIGNENIADLGGIDDSDGIYDDLWGDLIDIFPPISGDDINTDEELLERASCPVIDSPIRIGDTSVSGTSTEVDGTIIEVFKDEVSLGTTTVTSGTWSLTGLSALADTEVITATATVPESAGTEKATSIDNCSSVTVATACSPTISSSTLFTLTNKGICGDNGSAIEGAEIKVYYDGALLTPNTGSSNYSGGQVFADIGGMNPGSWYWKCNTNDGCTAGGGCSFPTSGFFQISQTVGGSCESYPFDYCVGVATSTTPTFTDLPTTASSSISGTATSGARVIWYLDNVPQDTTTANGGGNWTFIVSGLLEGEEVKISTLESGLCAAYTTDIVGGDSNVPMITGEYCTVSTISSVNGISGEIGGMVTLYTNGSGSVTTSNNAPGTTTVTSDGSWTISGLSIPIDTFMAATVTGIGELESPLSNELQILEQTTDGSLTIITSSLTEGDASITGTGTIGNTIALHIDGIKITGFNDIVDGAGDWTISGLDEASAGYDVLYTGGVVSVSSKNGSLCESVLAIGPTVGCTNPVNQPFSAISATTICEGESISFDVDATEGGIAYQLIDQSGNQIGPSVLGDGNSLSLVAENVDPTVTGISLKAVKIGTVCATISSTISVSVESIIISHVSQNPVSCMTPDGTITLSGLNNNQGYDVDYKLDGISVNDMLTSNGSGEIVIPNLGPGEYTEISVTGLATTITCTSNVIAGPVVLTNPSAATLTLGTAIDPTTCGGSDGSIALMSSIALNLTYTVNYLQDGTPQSVVLPSDASGNILLSGLGAGTYSNISITNVADECKSNNVGPVTLSEPIPTIAVSGSSNPVSCGGNGTIDLSFSGIPNGTYDIDYFGGTFSSVSVAFNAASISAAAGTYSNLSITNPVTGCTSIDDPEVVINDPTTHTIDASRTNPAVCGANGTINLTFTNVPDNTYAIDYQDGAGNPQTFFGVSVASNAATISTQEGIYNNLSLTLTGCISSGFPDVTLTDPPPPSVPTVASQLTNDPTPAINGTSDPSIPVNVDVGGAAFITTSDGIGDWSVDTGDPPDAGTFNPDVNGVNEVVVTVGEGSCMVNDLTTNELTIDTTFPMTPTINAQSTNNTSPTVSGTAETGTTLSLSIGGATYEEVIDGTGTWSFNTTVDVPVSGSFTPLAEATYDLVVNSTDLAGNVSSDATSDELIVDTTDPINPVINTVVTNDNSPTLDGTGEVASTISITLGGATFEKTVDGAGDWSIDTSSDTPVSGSFTALSDGTYDLSVTSTDAAGNFSSDLTTDELTVDTVDPSTPTINSQSTSNTSPVIEGTGEIGTEVTLTLGGATFTKTVDGSGDWTIDTSSDIPTSGTFTPLADATYDLAVTSTDDAGNTAMDASTDELTIDTLDPSIPTINSQSTNNGSPTISGTGEVGTTITLPIGGATFSKVIDGTGNWSINTTVDTPISGSFTSLAEATYDLIVTSTDGAGNTSVDTSSDELLVDFSLPSNPVINFLKTNNTSPTITGTADLDNTILLQIGGATFETSVDGFGNWTINTLADIPISGTYTPLDEGTYDLEVFSTNESSSTSPDLSSNELTIDTTAPTVPAIFSQITNNTSPIISGTGEIGTTINLTLGGATFQSTVDNSGEWIIDTDSDIPISGTFDPLADGTYDLEISSTDDAGNSTSDASLDELLVDTIAPSIPTIGSLLTNDPEPLLSGTGEVGTAISLTIGGATFATTVDELGLWEIDPVNDAPTSGSFTALNDGVYDLEITSTDDAGNSTSDQSTDELTVDTESPRVPTIDVQTTSNTSPVISGTAEAGTTIGLDIGGATYTTITASDESWSIDTSFDAPVSGSFTVLDEGIYDLSVSSTDGAGNVSMDITVDELVISLSVPSAPTINNILTNNTSPVISGTADPGTTVTVEIGGATFSTIVDESGNWNIDTSSDDPSSGTFSPLADGVYDLIVTSTRTSSGSSSVDETADEVTIDTISPIAPVITTLTTSNENPIINGSGEPGTTITLVITDVTFETVTNDEGIWTVDTGTDAPVSGSFQGLEIGAYDLIVTSTDAAGNSSSDVTVNELVIVPPDSDADGLYDSDEDINKDGNLDNDDCDGDGLANYLDSDPCDSDEDGFDDLMEDSNGDGNPYNDDCDDDDIPNFLDPEVCDADGDGIFDFDEDLNGDGILANDDCDSDGVSNYLDTDPCDTDQDGLDDREEDSNSDGNPYNDDCDLNGIPDFQDGNDCDVIDPKKAFTPNGDGINDFFYIQGIEEFPDNYVQIFNRWGTLVFEIRGYNNQDNVWKSESNAGLTLGSANLPDGTYYYVIDLGDGSKPKSGYVIIN